MNKANQLLLNLVSAEIFGKQLNLADFIGLTDQDWKQVLELSCPHNVQAITLDGIMHHLPENSRPSKMITIAWTAMTQNVEKNYLARTHVIAKLAKLFKENEMDMMLIKGVGLASLYPIPQHRSFSDIDFHVSDYQKADQLIAGLIGYSVDFTHHHHTTCSIDGILIENHYDFINVHAHRSSASFEKKLKELAELDCKEEIFIEGQRVLLPPANFNALFLSRHAASHWAAAQLGLKNVCDWGLFLKNQSGKIDMALVNSLLRLYNMNRFIDSINTILVEWMGLDSKYIPGYTHKKTDAQWKLSEKVLEELISPSFPHKRQWTTPNPLYDIIFRTRRFFANKWKHDICYSDSLLSSFIYDSISHFRSPKLPSTSKH